MIKDIFNKKKQVWAQPNKSIVNTKVPDSMWIKCTGCKKAVYRKKIEDNLMVCPHCSYHMRLSAAERIRIIVDAGTFERFDFEDVVCSDPLNFPGYKEKLEQYSNTSGLRDAVVCGTGKICGHKAVICVMDSNFLMGSMGYVVGECITRSVEYATENSLPIIIFTASGGARMQEGIISLMQMAKISGALAKHNESGLLYLTVITDPTTGGVTASFAMLGDIIMAERGALIGFAGKRVIEQTIKQKLPPNFQSAEFMASHGFVDLVCERDKMKNLIGRILTIHGGGKHE